MNDNYRAFFGLNKEPFGADISLSEILKTPELVDVKDRFDYVIRLGAIGFEKDSKPWLPVILAGQNSLIDKLTYRSSQPLASRIVAKSHLEGVDLKGMETYLQHHLTIAGIDQMLFDQGAVTAIHQGSGGLFRKANHLARGALIAATADKSGVVNAEHVRLAATEVF